MYLPRMSRSQPMLNHRSSRADREATSPLLDAAISASRTTANSTEGAPVHLTAGVGQTLLKVIDASSRTIARMRVRIRRRSATMPPQPDDVGAKRPGQKDEGAGSDRSTRGRRHEWRHDNPESDDLDDAHRLAPAARRQRGIEPAPHVPGGYEQISHRTAEQHPGTSLPGLPGD